MAMPEGEAHGAQAHQAVGRSVRRSGERKANGGQARERAKDAAMRWWARRSARWRGESERGALAACADRVIGDFPLVGKAAFAEAGAESYRDWEDIA